MPSQVLDVQPGDSAREDCPRRLVVTRGGEASSPLPHLPDPPPRSVGRVHPPDGALHDVREMRGALGRREGEPLLDRLGEGRERRTKTLRNRRVLRVEGQDFDRVGGAAIRPSAADHEESVTLI